MVQNSIIEVNYIKKLIQHSQPPFQRSLTRCTQRITCLISLVGVCLQVAVKIIANHMKVLMPNNIRAFQGAFVYNRQILDGILVANKLIDSKKTPGKRV